MNAEEEVRNNVRAKVEELYPDVPEEQRHSYEELIYDAHVWAANGEWDRDMDQVHFLIDKHRLTQGAFVGFMNLVGSIRREAGIRHTGLLYELDGDYDPFYQVPGEGEGGR